MYLIKEVIIGTFVEVLVSLVLLSIVILSVGTTQFSSLQTTRLTYYLTVATTEINNLNQLLASSYDNKITDIDTELTDWRNRIAESLPQGSATLHGTYPYHQIAVYWGGATANTCFETKASVKGCIIQAAG